MGFNLNAEVEKERFLNWVDENLQKIKNFLLLEHEDLLINLYENQNLIN